MMVFSLLPQSFFIWMIISKACFSEAYKLCLDDQKILLLELKNNLTFNSTVSTKLVRWGRTDDCCKWKGVECDASGRVIGLRLDNEGISGGILNSSSLVSLKYMEKLNFANNSFDDESMPWSLFNHPSLEQLILSHNNLSFDPSGFDSNFSGICHLKKLSLASCNLQKFPDFIQHFNLNFLDLSDNQISGEIPSWVWEIGNGQLYHLNLSRNLLVGLQKPYHIPSFLSELDLSSNLLRGELPLLPRGASYVDFSNNRFENPIPIDFVSFNFFLIFLSIANNTITGSIPTSICGAPTVQVIDLGLNNLSGSIPPCLVESTSSLQSLNLKRNNVGGDIPDKFPTNCGLRFFDLSNNNLRGNFPISLGNCKSLEVVNLAENLIGGSFPCMLPSKLIVLVLRSNRFQGEVKCSENWRNLQIIDISSNNFSGELHHISFSSWRKMEEFWDALRRPNMNGLSINVVRPDHYYLTRLTMTLKGFKMEIIRILQSFTLIDMSSNNFHGEIPDDVGDLSLLRYLNLSHNALTGIIPKSLGGMASMESLDLSANQLTGVIPEELARLHFLSSFNVSDNKLVGKIPEPVGFPTFENDSYKGNDGLCGAPLIKTCNDSFVGNNGLRGDRLMKRYNISSDGNEIEFAALTYLVALASFLSLLS